MDQTNLPINTILPDLRKSLRVHANLVVQAPPGAGKTTAIPLALLDEPWLGEQKIIMLEPRRLAARMAAGRMAQLSGEKPGETIGYQVRFDRKTSSKTRIEVLTEGLLVRRLQDDPELNGVGIVIFDEFHERNLDADLGLALCLEAQEALRADLKILVMSATLDGDAVSKLMNNAPVLTSVGKSWPVETRFPDRPGNGYITDRMATTIQQSLRHDTGSILAFLPGVGEIMQVERLLNAASLPSGTTIAPLYGNLTPQAQEKAISPPASNTRKVVLATSIAETSLTIEGIKVVVDSGYMRVPKFDPRSGMNRLETVKVSRASADQRRGRAGRMAPGICYRLWTEAEDQALMPYSNPEMLDADLTPLVLQLACWGVDDPLAMRWLTPPPPAPWAQARQLLSHLGALQPNGQISPHGKAMAKLPLHPRLAHMVLKAGEMGALAQGARLAALLEERSIFKGSSARADADIHFQLQILENMAQRGAQKQTDAGIDQGLCRRILEAASQIIRQAPKSNAEPNLAHANTTGLLIAMAYPDRVAKRRRHNGLDYLLANGRGAVLKEGDPLAQHEFLAIASLDGGAAQARIYLAAALGREQLDRHFRDRISEQEIVEWDGRQQAVTAEHQTRLGQIVLKKKAATPPPEQTIAAAITGIRSQGLECLPWTDNIRNWQQRLVFLRRFDAGNAWPDVSDDQLMATLEDWLAPFLDGILRRTQFATIDLQAALRTMLNWDQLQLMDKSAPTHIKVPSGSNIPVDYATPESPILAVRLQEMLGAVETPTICNGQVPLTLHLLSPAGRPLQVTPDLAGFWTGSYLQVKSEMKGRYPKHYWPDDPLTAEPTNRAKRRKTS